MTEKQFNEYKRIRGEISPIEEFLNNYDEQRKNERVGFMHFCLKLIRGQNSVCNVRNERSKLVFSTECGTLIKNRDIPPELGERIINTVKQWVDERKAEMDSI